MIKNNQTLKHILNELRSNVINDYPECLMIDYEDYDDLKEFCSNEEMNAFDDYFAITMLLSRIED